MISIKNVSKTYNNIADQKTPVLSDFNLDVLEGELFVLLGASGCGKSTVLRLVNALIQPDSGDIFINGKDIRDTKAEILRRHIGYAIQDTGLFPHYNVYENISIVPRLLKWSKPDIEKRVDEMLELVGLGVDCKRKSPRELSGGEAQRVGVARALAANPPVLLMDEPFGALDPLNRERLQKEFLKIQKYLGKTVLFVTHDVEEAIRLADRIGVMRRGAKFVCGRPESFLYDKESNHIKEFLGSEYAVKLLSRYYVRDYADRSDTAPALQSDIACTIKSDSTVSNALAVMLAGNFAELRIEDDGADSIGTITYKDILSVLSGKES